MEPVAPVFSAMKRFQVSATAGAVIAADGGEARALRPEWGYGPEQLTEILGRRPATGVSLRP